jgi:Signal transduction histidine kinase
MPIFDLSASTLAFALEQSQDCVKLLSPDGGLRWMNPNGQCLMAINDFSQFSGKLWHAMWPDEVQHVIHKAYRDAEGGAVARFKAQSPTAAGDARWWEVSVQKVTQSDGSHGGFISISRDVTEQESDHHALQAMVAEMHHRLKNTYTLVTGMVKLTGKGDPAIETFARDTALRLSGLATAQTIASRNDALPDIAQLVRDLVMPFGFNKATTLTIDVVDAPLTKRMSDALALILGELAVNSLKYGAIANGGSISIAGKIDGAELVMTWGEQSQAEPTPSSEEGSGISLMKRLVQSYRGTFAIEWRGSALYVEFRLPASL